VRLRSSRPVTALIATGVAAATVALASVPAQASTVRRDEWWLTALGVRRAWTTSEGAGVTVAILSDGVNPNQPDLTGSVTTGPDYTGAHQSGGFGSLGTGLASIIAGHGHAGGNAAGMMGVAPQARILSVRVTLPANDPGLAQPALAANLPDAIASGIMYAVHNGATVIDLPIDPGQPGVSGVGGATAAAGGSTAEKKAVAYALAHNVVLVAPAGDDGAGADAPNYPAGYPGVIAVGSFGPGFTKSQWTSRQSYVTVTSAGEQVIAAGSGGSYQVISSTSAASAVVAGMAALVRSSFPGLSAVQVRSALISETVSRHPNGLANGSGYGAVNAARALTAAAAEGPAADLAGAGSQPLATLSSPAPRSPQHAVTSQIIKAAIISASVLVLLLLLIALYSAMTRRRASRQQQLIAAEWAGRQAQSRYPQAGDADADRMLEFFAAPASAPASGAQRAGGRTGRLAAEQATTAGLVAAGGPGTTAGRVAAAGQRAAADQGVFAGPGRESGTIQAAARSAATGAAGAAGGLGIGVGSALQPPWGGADAGARSPLGPASRAIGRRPAVSGTPPWEPASQPDGDLPWGAAPERDQPVSQSRPPASAPSAFAPSAFAPSAFAPRAFAPPTTETPAAEAPAGPDEPVSVQTRQAAASPAPAPLPLAASAPPGWDTAEPAPFDPAAYEPASYAPASYAPPGSDTAGPGQATREPAEPGRGPGSGSRPGPDLGWQPAGSASAPAESAAGFAGHRGRIPGQSMTGRLDWSQSGEAMSDTPASPPSPAASSGPAPVQRSGGPLPVRQPGQQVQPPLSPSGSLWERVVEPASKPAEAQDPSAQPIYGWNPPGSADSVTGQEPEITSERTDWPAPEWPE
jgi:hypothetical protein